MEPVVGKERGQGGSRMFGVVVAELCQGEEAGPVCLLVVMPNDPLLPAISAAQAADPILSAHIQQLHKGPGEESNPPLLGGSPSSGSEILVYTLHGGLLYSQGRILISPTSSSLILQILQ